MVSQTNSVVKRTNSRKRLSDRELHAISRALADSRRFAIFKKIASGSCTACADLRGEFPITAATLSHHLKELESASLIEMSRDGKFVNTSLRREIWEAYLNELKNI